MVDGSERGRIAHAVPHSRHERRRARRRAPPPLTRECALFLDIDGTLLELAPTPDGVRVDGAIAALLPALARRLDGALALITGRTIVDADRLFPHPPLAIAGQHGCERRSANGSVHRLTPRAAGYAELRSELRRLEQRHRGLMLEDKGVTLAVHYRAAPRLAPHVHRTLRAQVARAAAEGHRFDLQRGKGLLEVRPEGRDKGTAIVEYMHEHPFRGRMPVFIGDDATDEFGFAAVGRLGGWAVKVGPGATHARYRLPNVTAVRRWLSAATLENA
jgi:trehalose 6-phosphate phosphatase